MAETIRERIEAGTQGAILDAWHAGNLIPADEVQARIDSAVAKAVVARDAEWRREFHSESATDYGVELFGPRGPEEARTFITESEKFAVEIAVSEAVREERQRFKNIVNHYNVPGHSVVGPALANIYDAIDGGENGAPS